MTPEPVAGESAVAGDRGTDVDRVARRIAEDLATLDIGSPQYRMRLADIDGIADAEIHATTMMSGRWLDSANGGGAQQNLIRDVQRLRAQIAALEGAREADDADHAERTIGDLVGRLRDSEHELTVRNAVLAQEDLALGVEVDALRRYSQLTGRVAELLEAATGPVHAEALTHLRKRQTDILAQMETALAGHAALKLTRARNRDLSRAIELVSKAALANLRVVAERTASTTTDAESRAALDGVIEALDRWMTTGPKPS